MSGFSYDLRPVFATYVHDLNPVIISFSDAIKLRWYGLAYLAAFLVAVFLLNKLAKKQLWVLKPGAAGDFIAAAAIFGVFIGGRLGYMFYYEVIESGWGWITQDPFKLIRVWDGGMASHGGILGLVIFTWVYARIKKVSWTGLGDGLCVVAPLGLMFGRLANFINGELYGKVTQGIGWAVKFPNTLLDHRMVEFNNFDAAFQAALEADEGLQQWASEVQNAPPYLMLEAMKEAQRNNPDVSAAIEPYLMPRHPSQLYEAMLEGLLLFAVLWFIRVRYPKLPNGILTGLFFILYAIGRIVGEAFREPESKVGIFTNGQFLSLFMIGGGAAFIIYAIKKGKPVSCSES